MFSFFIRELSLCSMKLLACVHMLTILCFTKECHETPLVGWGRADGRPGKSKRFFFNETRTLPHGGANSPGFIKEEPFWLTSSSICSSSSYQWCLVTEGSHGNKETQLNLNTQGEKIKTPKTAAAVMDNTSHQRERKLTRNSEKNQYQDKETFQSDFAITVTGI